MLKIRQKKEILAKRSGDTSKSLCQQYRSQHVQSHCLNGWWSISREIRWQRARNEWESWLQWSWWSRDLSYAGKVAACKRPVNKGTTAIRNLYFRLLLVDSSEIDVQSQVRFLAIIWFEVWSMKVHHKKRLHRPCSPLCLCQILKKQFCQYCSTACFKLSNTDPIPIGRQWVNWGIYYSGGYRDWDNSKPRAIYSWTL